MPISWAPYRLMSSVDSGTKYIVAVRERARTTEYIVRIQTAEHTK